MLGDCWIISGGLGGKLAQLDTLVVFLVDHHLWIVGFDGGVVGRPIRSMGR